jgi:hypothetical protein
MFNVLAGMSLALCMGAVVFWARSYRTIPLQSRADEITFTSTDPRYWIISHPGRAVLCRQTGSNWNGRELAGFGLLGVKFGGVRGVDGSLLWTLEIPYWLIVASMFLLPCAAIIAWRRERKVRLRHRVGQCGRCGYDLRATPERCPECGTITKTAT